MRCLYCGKELALLKRWTRGGQFCSEAHKKSYQDEYNRIGLSRLLQAQAKPKASQQEAVPEGGSKTPPGHAAPVAVEEAPLEAIEESPQTSIIEQVLEQNPQLEPQAPLQKAVEEPLVEEPVEEAWEPANMAGFVNDTPAEPVSVEVEIAPHVDPWRPGELPAVPPRWQSHGVLHQYLPEAA